MNIENGVSLVLTNNNHGENIWEKIIHDTICLEGNIEEAALFNGNLIHPTIKPNIRNGIYKRIDEEGYRQIAAKEFRSPQYWKIKLKSFILYNPIILFIKRLHI